MASTNKRPAKVLSEVQKSVLEQREKAKACRKKWIADQGVEPSKCPCMSDLLLWSRDRMFGLSLKESLLLEGLKECADSATQETGGVIVGFYTPAHDCAVVTALSGPPEDSIRGPRIFERGTKGIQRWISRLWREQRHFYLGEWHYHPGGAPVPSPDDREQMQKLSKDRKLKCPEPILLIIGGNPKGAWTANAYIFPADQDCVPLLPDQDKKAEVVK